MKTLKKVCSNIYLIFIFVLLYAPILTLMVLSFNQSKSRARWGGFTTQWYTELFQNEEILLAFRNTMIIAFLSALIATLIGLCACMAMNNMKKRWRSIFMGIANIPMLNAEIVTGISLMERHCRIIFMNIWRNIGKQIRLWRRAPFCARQCCWSMRRRARFRRSVIRLCRN